jgi:hypothetical protein
LAPNDGIKPSNGANSQNWCDFQGGWGVLAQLQFLDAELCNQERQETAIYKSKPTKRTDIGG